MKILFITFYFEPDLSAGSFRNTALFKELQNRLGKDDFIQVITTQPNRYDSYKMSVNKIEKGDNYKINRINIPSHKSGMFDQAKSYLTFFFNALKIVKHNNYDIVYASSSRLFTAFLGRYISKKKHIKLYLDIRDIFVDTMKDVLAEKKILRTFVLPFIKCIEKYTFRNATNINLVSEGFKTYFAKYQKPAYSYFTNGIDDIFLNVKPTDNFSSDKIIITYAGNIGSGQGLEKIIPQAAKELGDKYLFYIIGDGSTRVLLENKIQELDVKNVELIKPVKRNELIEYYEKSTFLFFHLNDLPAFEKVIPSKVFEYGAFDKPVMAGVAGYVTTLIKENLTNYILFNPCDVQDMVEQIKNYHIHFEDRLEFKRKFSRKNITKEMVDTILNLTK